MTNTQNTETSSNADIDTLESLYKSMSQNSAVFHAILNGSGSSENPGLSTVLSQLSGGTTQLKSGLYSDQTAVTRNRKIIQSVKHTDQRRQPASKWSQSTGRWNTDIL